MNPTDHAITKKTVSHTPLSDAEIASLAHTLFLYCTARTDNAADAEDLCGGGLAGTVRIASPAARGCGVLRFFLVDRRKCRETLLSKKAANAP